MKLHLSHFEETEGKVIAESGCLYCCLIAKPPLLFSDSFSTPWTAQQSPLSMEFSRQVLEWVAFSFSSGSSWPRDWTLVSCFGFTTEVCYQICLRVWMCLKISQCIICKASGDIDLSVLTWEAYCLRKTPSKSFRCPSRGLMKFIWGRREVMSTFFQEGRRGVISVRRKKKFSLAQF